MPIREFKNITPGRPVSAAEMNRLGSEVSRLYQLTATPPLLVGYNGAGYQFSLDTSQLAVVKFAKATTSTADGDGRYSAVLTTYNAEADAWTDDAGVIKIEPLNSATLTSGNRYAVVDAGSDTGVPVYLGLAGSGSGGITVALLEISNPSTVVASYSATTLQITSENSVGNTNEAYSLTNPTTDVARLTIKNATTTNPGIISIGAQDLAGTKTLTGSLACIASSGGAGVNVFVAGWRNYGNTGGWNVYTREDDNDFLRFRGQSFSAEVIWASTDAYTPTAGGYYKFGGYLSTIYDITAGVNLIAASGYVKAATEFRVGSDVGQTVNTGGLVFTGGILTSGALTNAGLPTATSFMGF